MTKQNRKHFLLTAFLSACIGGEIALLADAAVSLLAGGMPSRYFAAVWLASTAAILLFPKFTQKGRAVTFCVVLAAGGALYFAGSRHWNPLAGSLAYQVADSGKEGLYAGKSVMLIVPHEDDDVNVAGGVLEAFVEYGSDVRVVFVTNGDYYGKGETRIREAISYCGYIGIPEDRVFFLGYGDQWSGDGPHLYNAPPGAVRQSFAGNTATYGTPGHPAYRDGSAYTVDNLLFNLQSILLEYRPDVILCSDYDTHIDHRAVSLAFDKAMGNILRSGAGYTPVVLKGFSYSTAWHAPEDYYTLNLLSTQKTSEFEDPQSLRIYRWEDRVRLPVSAALLSRSLLNSPFYTGMKLYDSQNVTLQAARVINGDKVFWQRRTDSLCYGAKIRTSSGNGALLNDFMLIEDRDLLRNLAVPCDGTWVPEAGDEAPTVTVTFPEKTDVERIVLYDSPAADQNILNARIRFDDGTLVETGPLDPNGAASAIVVNKTGVSGFQILLTQTEGDRAGLSEVEAFRGPAADSPSFIKLMDKDGNFAYDYCLEESGEACFFLYTWGEGREFTPENYTVHCVNKRIRAKIGDGKLSVFCPYGAEGTVTVTSTTGEFRDSVYLRNPISAWRQWARTCQERDASFDYSLQGLRNMVVCRVWQKIAPFLRPGT